MGGIESNGQNNYIGFYGNLAFGVASLLIIYNWIVEPQLERAQLDRSQLKQIVDEQSKISRQLQETVGKLEALIHEKRQ